MDDSYKDDQYNMPPKIDNSENAEKWEGAFLSDSGEQSESQNGEGETNVENSLDNLLAVLGDASGYDGINSKIDQALRCDPDDDEQIKKLLAQYNSSYDEQMKKSEAFQENSESARLNQIDNPSKSIQAASRAIKEFHLRYSQVQDKYGQKALDQGTDIAHFVFNDVNNPEPVRDVTFSAFCSRIHMGDESEDIDAQNSNDGIPDEVAEEVAQNINNSFGEVEIDSTDVQEMANEDDETVENPTAEELQRHIEEIYQTMNNNEGGGEDGEGKKES